MLAVPGHELPQPDREWSFELKWDGIRTIVYVSQGRTTLQSRNGRDLTGALPELRALGEQLGHNEAVLDGEVVVFDDAGRPSFQLLQGRIHATGRGSRNRPIGRPVTLVLFDLVYLGGELLCDLAYRERRRRLESLGLERGASWTVSPRFEGGGSDVLVVSRQQGLEGVVAKRSDSPYRAGRRSADWVKVKNLQTEEVVIGGWALGQGQRAGQIGSLLVGVPSVDGLRYVGRVGSGLSGAELSHLARRLAPLESSLSPFAGELPARYRKEVTWVRPELVGEVRFYEWTGDGLLRHPVWRGLREDKSPDEVVREL
ncbi:MAG TPA: non-homologous end-joining DNA ligase [Acidimicrobiales bacterium]|nr:non-homologous end-joining DNA ligase [Acidimicrobiales bacterium]